MAAQKRTPRRVKVPGEPYLYERPGANPRVFEVVWRDADRKLHHRTVEGGIMAARAERDRIVGDRASGKTTAEPRMTFGKAARSWLDSLERRELRESTRAEYRRNVDRLSGWHTRRLDSIEADNLVELLANLRAEGLGGRSCSLVLGAVGQVYRHAARMGWRGQDPTRLLEKRERPSSKPGRRAIFQGNDELGQVLAAAHEPYRTLFLVLTGTGCRVSEALGLVLDDLTLDDDPRISFRHQLSRAGERVGLKTDDSEGVVPIPESLAAALREHLARTMERGIPGEYVFATRSGRPLGHRNVTRELRRAQVKARRPDGTPTYPALHEGREVERGEVPGLHSFRHTLATRMSDAGATAEEIQRQLRHADANVTRSVYIRELKDAERRRGQRERIAKLIPEVG